MTKFSNALGLDIGDRRIGVARVNSIARLPEPLVTLTNDQSFAERLRQLLNEHSADLLVIGLPRDMSGGLTDQSRAVQQFVAANLGGHDWPPIVWQDETLTTQTAEQNYAPELIAKVGIDSLAAAEILKLFLLSTEAK